jgi:hypothetical protein
VIIPHREARIRVSLQTLAHARSKGEEPDPFEARSDRVSRRLCPENSVRVVAAY